MRTEFSGPALPVGASLLNGPFSASLLAHASPIRTLDAVIMIALPPHALDMGPQARIYQLDPQKRAWRPLASEVTQKGFVQVRVDALGTFALIAR